MQWVYSLQPVSWLIFSTVGIRGFLQMRTPRLIPATPFEPTARVLIGFGKPDSRDVKMCSVVFRGPCLLLNRANREGSCFRAAQALWAIQASSALRFLTRSIDWLTATGSSTSPARSSEPSRRIVGEAGDQNHHR
jgi:hypothetical protein